VGSTPHLVGISHRREEEGPDRAGVAYERCRCPGPAEEGQGGEARVPADRFVVTSCVEEVEEIEASAHQPPAQAIS
jgi:hypothetical protein